MTDEINKLFRSWTNKTMSYPSMKYVLSMCKTEEKVENCCGGTTTHQWAGQIYKRHQHFHSAAVNSADNDLLYSHVSSIEYYTDFMLESCQCKVHLMSSSTNLDICVHTFTSSGWCLQKFRVAVNVWKQLLSLIQKNLRLGNKLLLHLLANRADIGCFQICTELLTVLYRQKVTRFVLGGGGGAFLKSINQVRKENFTKIYFETAMANEISPHSRLTNSRGYRVVDCG